jgi:hypothetical protein
MRVPATTYINGVASPEAAPFLLARRLRPSASYSVKRLCPILIFDSSFTIGKLILSDYLNYIFADPFTPKYRSGAKRSSMRRAHSREADDLAAAIMALVDGCALAVGHVYECLDRSGVMKRSEALFLLREAIAQLPAEPPGMVVILRKVANRLQETSHAPPVRKRRSHSKHHLRLVRGSSRER